jgi:hypothetical protein
METAAVALVVASTVLTALAVLALFVWAARMDGEDDRAIRARPGRRRRPWAR